MWAANDLGMSYRSHPPLTIALISEAFTQDLSDAARSLQGLIPALLGLGLRVQHIGIQADDDWLALQPRLTNLRLPGISVPGFRHLHWGWPAGRTLARAWRQDRPDVLYLATRGPLAWSALQVAHRLGIPVLLGPDPSSRGIDGLSRRPWQQWLRHYQRHFVRHSRATLWPTRTEARQCWDALNGQVVLWPWGVDREVFYPRHRCPVLRASWGAQDDTLVVLYAGPLANAHNLALAERAFAQAQALRPNSRMVWLGDGPEHAEMAAALSGHHFAGVRQGIDLARHLASADLLLWPSLAEPSGHIVLEAMACGLPVVAFHAGAAAAWIRPMVNGLTAPQGDEAAFLHLVEYAAEYRSVIPEIGLRAANTPFPTWPESASQWVAMVRQVLADEALPRISQQQDEGEQDALSHYTTFNGLGSGVNPEV